MPNARIVGAGMVVPPRVVTNADLSSTYGIDTDDAWIVQRTGVRERRFADEGVRTSDLAVEASRRALARAGLPAEELDLIVVATLSPDMAFPGVGVAVQAGLGLPDAGRFVPALDVRNQCSGFLYGLAVADAMIRAGSARRVLLVGAELHSAALDLTSRGRAVSTLFGDGAGAVVLEATDADAGVRGVWLGADGRHVGALCQPVWDMGRRPFVRLDEQGNGVIPPEELWARMDGRLVYRHAIERLGEILTAGCAALGTTPRELDLVLIHQANLRIVQSVVDRLGVDPARVVNHIDRYGNTTAATLPILLAECAAEGRLRPGMRVGLAAFGSGFTWGAAVLDW